MSGTCVPGIRLFIALARTKMSVIAEEISAAPGTIPPPTQAADPCFHCGQPCTGSHLARDDRNFCCQGCLVVQTSAQQRLGHFSTI